MLNFPKWKILLILSVCFFGVVFALPNITDNKLLRYITNKSVNLGLDLKGGSHLLLEVGVEEYLSEQLDVLKDLIRKELRNNKIGYYGLKVIDKKINLSLRDIDQANQAKKIIQVLSTDLVISESDKILFVNYDTQFLKKLSDSVVNQSIEIIRRRVDETGTKEPSIQRQGEKYILLQVPGLENPDHLKSLLGKTAKLSFHLVSEQSADSSLKDKIFINDENSGREYVLYKKAIITGDMLNDAQATFNDKSQAVVSFKFNTIGAKKFADATRENVGKLIAIVLDNSVISAAVINEPILGGSGIISGNFTVKSANDLALLLRAGALPAPLKVIEERVVGPSLGRDSIESGKVAAIISMVAITVFMFLTYGIFGIFANIALVFNMVFIIAALSLLQATLTLPGIAGIILTMGMAVDANVLIFERIREEAKLKLSVFATIEKGFKHAFATIFDSNITTIIAAGLLYIFGSGTIKGFAVTLIIGIIISLFSAITLTRLMLVTWVKYKRPKHIYL
jgi:preprotein translocase subunit SecD